MTVVLKVLGRGLDPEVGRALRSAAESLARQLRFMAETNKAELVTVTNHGYSEAKLLVILELAAFFHLVVAPIAASGRHSTSELVTGIPVQHGQGVFDRGSSTRSRAMDSAFQRILSRLGIRGSWIAILNADDIVWRIAKSIEGDGEDL